MYLFSDRHAPAHRAGKISLKVVGCVGAGLFVFLGLVCVAGGAGYYYYWYKPAADKTAKEKERQQLHDAFAPELSSYLDIKVKPPGPKASKFKGKVVCVDKDKKEIDAETQAALPDTLKATKPDEVGAVAWLSWSEEVAGDYPDGAKAKIYVVRVTLIDKQTGMFLMPNKEIRGGKQETKITSGDRTGPRPFDQLAELLQQYADSQ